MKKLTVRSQTVALALAATLIGTTAVSLAQNSRRNAPSPETRFRIDPDRTDRSSDSRDLHDFINDLESSSADDIRTGRVGRFFTNPAVIITDGQVHDINWDRFRDNTDNYRRDRTPPDDQSFNVRIENFETRRIDPNTVVVMYTAVQPDQDGGDFHQPVVATLVRANSSRGWRVASYTAEDAAIPGGSVDNEDRAPLR